MKVGTKVTVNKLGDYLAGMILISKVHTVIAYDGKSHIKLDSARTM